MSNTLTIGSNGQAWIGFEEFAGAAGYFYDPDKPPIEGMYQYEEHIITFPGELTAAGTKRNLFGPSVIICPMLLVVATTLATARSNAKTQLESWNQVARYTVTLPNGITRADCKLVREASNEMGWRRVGAGAFAVEVLAIFRKLSTS